MLPIRDLCATAFGVLLSVVFYEKKNAALHLKPRMNAVFALDVATALQQMNRQMVPPLWEGTLLLFNPWTHGFFTSILLFLTHAAR